MKLSFRSGFMFMLAVLFLLSSMPVNAVNPGVLPHMMENNNPGLNPDEVDQDAPTIYNDAKFGLKYAVNNNTVTITVARKDDTFNNQTVQFTYNFYLKNNRESYLQPNYIILNPGENSKTVNVSLHGAKLIEIPKYMYGIRFIPQSLMPEYTGIRDDQYELRLEVLSRNWFTNMFVDSHVKYNFYNRNNKSIDCDVIIKRYVTMTFDGGNTETKWASFLLPKGKTEIQDQTLYRDHLNGIITSPTDYYFQFKE